MIVGQAMREGRRPAAPGRRADHASVRDWHADMKRAPGAFGGTTSSAGTRWWLFIGCHGAHEVWDDEGWYALF
jgi:hypothetical protein